MCIAGTGSLMAQDEYEQWRKQQEGEFQRFVEERDREFVAFLKQEWKQMQLMHGLVLDEKPKPVHIPAAAPAARDDTLTARTIVSMPAVTPPPEMPLPEVGTPAVESRKNHVLVKIGFYGVDLSVSVDGAMKISLGQPVGKDAISRFWERMSQTNYPDLLKQTSHYARQMRLNDWGSLELMYALGREICRLQNEAILFTWFLACKSGYDARVGFSGERVALLVPTNNTLYSVPFLTVGEKRRRYYLAALDPHWTLDEEHLYTYEGEYPHADGGVAFSIATPPVTEGKSITKTLRFSYNGQDHALPVRISMDAVRFFEYYPQTEFKVYFDATPSPVALSSLEAALRPLLQGKTEREAVSVVLRFVQTAFGYKTDPEQFGREKPMFPDETLYYGYSDCEDRAVLFARLVRTLTGLDVVGLDYPGHVATAVRFTDDVPGTSVTHRGRTYVLCDPTYVNAGVGDCMPELANIEPGIIAME